jgi:GNAT superfamily N-acetyltransferase
MTKIAVLRLNEGSRIALTDHFLALSPEDRRLRFGSSLAPDALAGYVAAIDFERDAVFGVHDERLTIVGAAHAAFSGGHAELGISVLPAHRGRGVGTTLFERAAEHARNRFVPRLFMHCLSENAAILRIAQRAGMDIVTEAGDADAHLRLPPASPESITGEYMTDRFALYDFALKAHVAAWKRINEALEDAAAT